MFLSKLTTTLLKFIKSNVNSKRNISGKVRVRFAPSPTGYLHLGGLRTALYNHLFAKSQNGVTILRIEDTDQTRKVESATENLIEDLNWCGINYDEGPYFQSDRIELYKKHLEELLERGNAYHCFCSKTRLDLLRKEALKARETPKYDNKCRHLQKAEVEEKLKNGEPYCVRFKLCDFNDSFNDLIHGPVSYNVAEIEGDPIIFKNDGFPTYHFANVVDDHYMDISHVLRGVEWQISTIKHLLLYKALKWEPPIYGHLPLLLNPNGTKISKRQGDAAIRNLRESGYLPNSVINFIIRTGGGFDITKKEKDLRVFTLQELINKFNISTIRSSSCCVHLNELPECNQLEIQRLLKTDEGVNTLVKAVKELVQKHFEEMGNKVILKLDDKRIKSILVSMQNRLCKLNDLVTKDYIYLWLWENKWNEKDEALIRIIEKLCAELMKYQSNWNIENLKEFLDNFIKNNGLNSATFMKTLRMILIDRKEGPSIVVLMNTLGKDDVQFRLTSALKTKRYNDTG